RQYMPDVAPPRLTELLSGSSPDKTTASTQDWMALCAEASSQALAELLAAREREGQRLADLMLACARDMAVIVDQVETDLPAILAEHQNKIATKLHDALNA